MRSRSPNWWPEKAYELDCRRCGLPPQAARVARRVSLGIGVKSKSQAVVSFLLAAVLALLAAPAWALGLGQIQVKSSPGQPLLAEIPIISGDPSELEQLQARLASPETFRRVGLEPPGSDVSGLQFAVALDARGNPVIRVTSAAPLQQPLLTFLLEVDWGDGRLVREYSALLDTPRTVAAPVEPLQAPTTAPSNMIERPAEVAANPELSSSPATPAPNAIASVIARPRAAARPAAPALSAANDYQVRSGDTLSQITARINRSGHSTNQTMLALLRANPDAFINDNINLVKAGAVLRMPPAEELSRYSASEADAAVRTQIAQWRQLRAPQQQPDAIAQRATGAGSAASKNTQGVPPTADARLEIVPPASGTSARAGIRSGIAAGGEGEMERQDLQQTKETLAARDAEVQELKSRVAELEKLQQQQQQLIQMKSSALTAAQQNLAKANTASSQQPAKPAQTANGGGWWLWGGLGLLVLALVGWLLMRGRNRSTRVRSAGFASGLATAMPTYVSDEDASGMSQAPLQHDEAEQPSLKQAEEVQRTAEIPWNTAAPQIAEAPRIAAVPRTAEVPRIAEVSRNQDSPSARKPFSSAVPLSEQTRPPGVETEPPHWTVAPAQVGTVPTWHGTSSPTSPQPSPEPVPASANDAEPDTPARRIELARAYLDLGDGDAARLLLLEALDGRDPAARITAARMLRDL